MTTYRSVLVDGRELFALLSTASTWSWGMKTELPTLTGWKTPRAIQLRIVRGARPKSSATSAIDNILGSSRAVRFGTGFFSPGLSMAMTLVRVTDVGLFVYAVMPAACRKTAMRVQNRLIFFV